MSYNDYVMKEREFERQEKEENPVLAICYDFDRTLTPDDMQAQGFIQSVGLDVQKFWDEANAVAKKSDMDKNLAYMYLMVQKSRGKFYLTEKALNDYGAKIALFNGVEEWFPRLNKYGKERGVIVEHYIVSSGLREMIEGTSIAKEFKKIYASAFCFDENGVPVWPAQTINYTNKTQFLFRIEKGCLDINDHKGVNEYFEEEKLRVPLRNFVYLGDSETDIPCMKLVTSAGGHAVGVYDPNGKKEQVYELMKNKRIRYFAPADYSKGGRLDELVKSIIDKTSAYETLEEKHNENLLETRNYFTKK